MSDAKPQRETTAQAAVRATRDAGSQDTGGLNTSSQSTGSLNNASQNPARQAAETAREITEKAADTTADATRRLADGGRDVMLSGAQTAADIGSRVGDLSYERGHRMLSSVSHMMDVYRDTSERSAGHVQSLMTSYLAMGRGLQQMQHAWLELLDQAIGHAAHKPQDLLRCRSLAELAEVQRDMFLDSVNYAVTARTQLLQLATRTAQDAVRPLENGA